MVLNPAEQQSSKGDMLQSKEKSACKLESDDDFKWEEFYGTSVDLSSSLLDMFDTIVAKNAVQNLKSSGPSPHPPCDPGGKKRLPPISFSAHNRPYIKKPYNESAFQEKKRPLSSSSVSSSSSSSSNSLPRNSLDVKKSYLASIESLDDDDDDEILGDVVTGSAKKDSAQGGQMGTVGRPRWCDPNLSHTDRVVLEIIDTEKTYVRDLNEIIQGYLEYISNSEEPKVSQMCLEELFSNIEDIYKFNRLFVNELDSCGQSPVAVAKCFVENSDGFEVYTQYCTNYPRTVSVLTELMGRAETAEIFKERQMALEHSLPLGSYLLKPVQRILKYHLLLQNMVKHANKESDGYCDIRNALQAMTGIAYHINDMKRKHEHAVRVQEIQSLLYGWEGEDLTTYGELVAEGAFRMYRAKALRHLFLFDKMLLIAKKKEEGILSYKAHIMCSNLMLIESIQGEPVCFHVIPFDNPKYQYTFQARNVEQKREWCLQLKRVILENYNAVIPSHARQLVMELGQSRQDDSASEKSTTRRQLSAPEYLERRKQERRKSEINLNRTFKLKKTIKKNQMNGHADNCDKSIPWRKSQENVCPGKKRWLLGHSNKDNLSDCSSTSSIPFSRSSRIRHSLPEPSTKDRRFRPSWKAWYSVPEETTDTEAEDIESKRMTEGFRDRTYSEMSDDVCDNSGEYVTFFYAHSYATRDTGDSAEIVTSADKCPVVPAAKIEKQRDQDSESGSSVSSSWKQNAALRRVQSFTGMAKAKMSSLQHNISFKHPFSNEHKSKAKKSACPVPDGVLPPPDSIEISPTTPANWLKQQEKHLAEGEKKSGSLPRSFQLVSENSEGETNPTSLTDGNASRLRVKLDGQKSHYGEQRPFTIASDKPSQEEFGDDRDYVLLDYSHCATSENSFRGRKDPVEYDTATGCTNTPAISLENVNHIHPELKIYHQSASKYTSLKTMFSNMGSKIAGLKATLLISPTSPDKADIDNDVGKNDYKRYGSSSSIRSDNGVAPRIFTAKLAHSVAKAYSSVILRHKKKHELKTAEKKLGSRTEKAIICSYKSESSLIGARMAQPLESEYSVPKNILPSKTFENLRPDSLFSESSNTTSSSEGDKNANLDFHKFDMDDAISEASDTSADSYYERKFDAFENALAHDIYRDSAIYSDPEDADFGTEEILHLENMNKSEPQLDKIHQNGSMLYTISEPVSPNNNNKLLCARRVNQSILDRLRVLEENVQFQKEEPSKSCSKPLKRLHLDRYGNIVKDVEESEASSERSITTMVLESRGSATKRRGHSPPRAKGWVKHVVEKLQGDGTNA